MNKKTVLKIVILIFIILLSSCTSNKKEVNLGFNNSVKQMDEKLLFESCEKKNYLSCYHLGRFYLYNKKNEVEALKKFELACENKIGIACFQVGTLKLDLKDQNIIFDKDKFEIANKNFEKGCEFNEYFSCTLVAKNLLTAIKTNKFPESDKPVQNKRVDDLLNKACRNNMKVSCNVIKYKKFDYPEYDQDMMDDMCTAGIIPTCSLPK
jgi:hypothetical protein